MTFVRDYLRETIDLLGALALNDGMIQAMAESLADLRGQRGRLFIIGNGGSAANASHAVNDFRKIARIEAYCPSDNVAELTAWANDTNFVHVYANWLRESYFDRRDALLVLSVGGGTKEVSINLVAALEFAKGESGMVLGIVGRDGGYTAREADLCLLIPTVNEDRVTSHVEEAQSIILHLLVSHPLLK